MPNSGNCMKAMLLRPQTWLMALVAAATLGMAAPQFAKADVVEYKMANRTHRVVSLKFYSRPVLLSGPAAPGCGCCIQDVRTPSACAVSAVRKFATAPGRAAGRVEDIGAFTAAIGAASAVVSDAAMDT